MSDASASFVACLSRVRGQLARTVLRGGRGREALPLPDTGARKAYLGMAVPASSAEWWAGVPINPSQSWSFWSP